MYYQWPFIFRTDAVKFSSLRMLVIETAHDGKYGVSLFNRDGCTTQSFNRAFIEFNFAEVNRSLREVNCLPLVTLHYGQVVFFLPLFHMAETFLVCLIICSDRGFCFQHHSCGWEVRASSTSNMVGLVLNQGRIITKILKIDNLGAGIQSCLN